MTEASAAPARPAWLKRWSLRLGIALAVLIVAGISLIGFAEHHTSQANFCGSCHIMEPYYASWQGDLHGGKLDVACVDCHYAPGERTTINAKLRGLSQVASYFSGRYGATRPRAHVSNDSCMTAKCHGDLRFMDKVIDLGSVRFVHATHLKLDTQALAATQKELEDLTQTIRAAVGDEQFGKLQAYASEAGPHEERVDKLQTLAIAASMEISRDELEKFSQLTHRRVRTAQLADIQCTNCHAYGSKNGDQDGPSATHHFSVSTTSCYTCHFNNEGFNTGTNSCLLCHKQLPAGEIIVHKELSPAEGQKLQSPELTAKTVKMNHQAILERKVDCASCHADVASEDSLVTQRDCQRCHDVPRYLEQWKEPLTLDLVAHYHKVHVPQQRAKCLDCHSEIHHQLIRQEKGQAAFLSSVMSNCTHCHPNHHREQLNLLSGAGAASVPQSTPNLMFGSRTNCFGCHTEMATTEHAGQVAKATLNGCIACHGDRHAQTFEKWKLGLELVQTEAEEAYAKARQALNDSKNISDQTRQKATELLTAANADLNLIKRGNGLHNVTYAMEVLDSVTQRAQQATALLAQPGSSP
jgi:nitrate/TMAO reductase-like tetraheme cytochrome c subunit